MEIPFSGLFKRPWEPKQMITAGKNFPCCLIHLPVQLSININGIFRKVNIRIP